MERIKQEIIQEMSETLVGKRVAYRDMTGKCDYFGYSFFESWGLQLTIDRTPISNVKISEIKLIPES